MVATQLNRPVRLAITTGEPAGIGPEVSLVAAAACSEDPSVGCVLIGDAAMLAKRAAALRLSLNLVPFVADRQAPLGAIEILDVPCRAPVVAGHLDVNNAQAVIAMLDRAIDLTAAGTTDAMVTAPVQKSIINDAGIDFTGHTEYLAMRTGTDRVVMMLVSDALRVALATTHVPLSRVPSLITTALIVEVLTILEHDLKLKFGLATPRIVVTGLNPHAGEGGHLGREEIEQIAPAIARCQASGMHVQGPYPADTLFQPKYLDRCDAVLAMYHDQGLPVLKFASFGHGVNITLGLPIIRTSVDHGTALDIAGQGGADATSMGAAIRCAVQMVRAQTAS